MQIRTSPHPAPEQLAAFASGQLESAELAEIESHLAVCATCVQDLETLPESRLVRLIRAVPADALALEGKSRAPRGQLTASGFSGTSSHTPTLPPELEAHPHYHIIELLATGGMGAVYRAEHTIMERDVALKIIHHKLVDHPEAVERFRREVKTAARLSHPNIVTAHDAGQAGSTHFLVMELVDGTSLDQVVKQRGPLPVAEACDYIRQAALALQYAFEHGMVHRDIKPPNLMLTPAGQVKVLDFGLARFASETPPPADEPAHLPAADPELETMLTHDGARMGTPDYMAPEQAHDPHQADIRADIYGLGCTLYYLVTGQPPFSDCPVARKASAHSTQSPVPLTQLRADVPASLQKVAARMLAKSPAERYQTPGEVATALEAILHPAPAVRRPLRRVLVAAMAFMLLLLLGLTVYHVATDKGELVIETVDKDIKILIERGGEQVTIVDPKSQSTLTLWTGTYKVKLEGSRADLELSRDQVIMKRGEQVVVKVTRKQDAKSLAELAPFDHGGDVKAIAFSPDGMTVASLGIDATPIAYDAAIQESAKRAPAKVLDRGRGDFLSMPVKLWDRVTRQVKRTLHTKGHTGEDQHLAFSPDGKFLAAVSDTINVTLWNLATGKELVTLQGHTDRVVAVAFSPDGKVVASAGWDETVWLWDSRTGERRQVLQPGVGTIWTLAYSPDGKALAIGGFVPIIKLFDVNGANAQELKTFDKGHTAWVRSLAFSPDGTLLASGSGDNTIKLWDVATSKELATLTGHTAVVQSVAFSPDGKWLASGSFDKSVRLWDVSKRQAVTTDWRHADKVMSVTFSPDGKTLASGGLDHLVRLWRLPQPSPVPSADPSAPKGTP